MAAVESVFWPPRPKVIFKMNFDREQKDSFGREKKYTSGQNTSDQNSGSQLFSIKCHADGPVFGIRLSPLQFDADYYA